VHQTLLLAREHDCTHVKLIPAPSAGKIGVAVAPLAGARGGATKLDAVAWLRCKIPGAGDGQPLLENREKSSRWQGPPARPAIPDAASGEETPECRATWHRRRRTPFGFWSSRRA
jgi:hypothetical protein